MAQRILAHETMVANQARHMLQVYGYLITRPKCVSCFGVHYFEKILSFYFFKFLLGDIYIVWMALRRTTQTLSQPRFHDIDRFTSIPRLKALYLTPKTLSFTDAGSGI